MQFMSKREREAEGGEGRGILLNYPPQLSWRLQAFHFGHQGWTGMQVWWRVQAVVDCTEDAAGLSTYPSQNAAPDRHSHHPRALCSCQVHTCPPFSAV